jgi:hypothetical protein
MGVVSRVLEKAAALVLWHAADTKVDSGRELHAVYVGSAARLVVEHIAHKRTYVPAFVVQFGVVPAATSVLYMWGPFPSD